jgi:GDP-4-dehydro-6-deoxy-D-mannose reductase
VPESWADPAGTIANNIVCQVNLLEAVRQEQLDPMLVIAISSEVYGQVPADELPVSERALLRPLSPYAVSKAGQDLLAYQYAAARHMRIIRLRVFNHIGPGQSDRFVVSNFARQLIEVERGERPPVLEVGDLTTQRDFCDVRDIVRAYHLAATYCTSGEAYNVGSGIPRTMHAVLNALIALSRVQVEVRTDPARLRPADVPVMWCDSSRFRDATGWHCTIPFEQSLRDVLDDWRARLASQQHRQV